MKTYNAIVTYIFETECEGETEEHARCQASDIAAEVMGQDCLVEYEHSIRLDEVK